MKAIILAAGRGSRMKDLTTNRPKCLVKINGKTLLDLQLEAIRSAGIEDIAIVTGYKREFLQRQSLVEFYNNRWSSTNMVTSLTCAYEWLEKYNCIISYSDIFYSTSAIKSLITCNESLAIAYDPNWLNLWKARFTDPLVDAETFVLSPNNYLTEIGNKPTTIQEVNGQYMGLLRFTPQSWSELMRIRDGLSSIEKDQMHMTGILQKIISAGKINIAALPYYGEWGEVDSIEDLKLYQHR